MPSICTLPKVPTAWCGVLAILVFATGCQKSDTAADHSIGSLQSPAAESPALATNPTVSNDDRDLHRRSTAPSDNTAAQPSKGPDNPPASDNNNSVVNSPQPNGQVADHDTGSSSAPDSDQPFPEPEDTAAAKLPAAAEPSGDTGTNPGDTILEIEGKDMDGEPFALSDYTGKVIMLDFWGDW